MFFGACQIRFPYIYYQPRIAGETRDELGFAV
jgi:hypothetical protein